jgi:predicted nucleic acid-binding protein
MILIDTSAWIDYFHDKQLRSPVAREVASLVSELRAITTGMVVAEVLQGASDVPDYEEVFETVARLPFVDAPRSVWLTAGQWSYELRRQGLTTPLSDLLIAAAAMAGGHEVYTTDPHFSRVQGLGLHQTRP